VDDAGDDADAADSEASAPRKWTGTGFNTNQTKIRACCNAMRAQAKAMGSSPEGFQLNTLATQCDLFVSQVGPEGTAPELTQLRQLLRSVNLPSLCAF
jgi:hypothetical protein